ncbi:hypothetical protein AB3S75_039883 [Citrus x aurantiifolia]
MEKLVSILSLHGGGVRGIIPGTILAFWESQLQKLDGEDAGMLATLNFILGTNFIWRPWDCYACNTK